MKMISLKSAYACGALFALGACGGGGENGGVMGASSGSLIGVQAETGADPTSASLVRTTATSSNSSGLSADFDGYTFNSQSGFENGSAVEDGSGIGALNELALQTDTDLILYDGIYDEGGIVSIYYGISGTEPDNALPSSGSATWTGISFADLVSATGTSDLGVGTATVTATFPGALSATITGLTGEVDEIALTGLSISGDRFSGSNIATSKSGSAVNVVGANASGDVAGIFSGTQTSAGIPDEVGGLFTLTGDDATLIGGFAAD